MLERSTHGVLALNGDDGTPYAVPLSYVYQDGAVIFHCAKEGYKLELLAKDSRASFAVVDADDIVGAEYTSYYRSVIAQGRVTVVTDDNQRLEALRALADKYSPEVPAPQREEKVLSCTRALILALSVEHLTGKQAIELVKPK